MPVKAMKPRPSPNEHAANKPVRSIVAIRRASIGVIRIVAVYTGRRVSIGVVTWAISDPDSNTNLSLRRRCRHKTQ
jgi:hypothetical protein